MCFKSFESCDLKVGIYRHLIELMCYLCIQCYFSMIKTNVIVLRTNSDPVQVI